MDRELVQQKRDLVGDYFEKLTASVFGGVIQPKGINDPQTGAPDIMNQPENQAYEVKSTTRGDWLKIDPEQVDHYRVFQETSFPDNTEVYYIMWSFQRQRGQPLEKDGLESFLALRHKAVIAVSLDIISAGLKVWPRSGSNGWAEYAALSGPSRRGIFRNPYTFLSDLKLNPTDYGVRTKNFPARFRIGLPTTSFRGIELYHKELRGLTAMS